MFPTDLDNTKYFTCFVISSFWLARVCLTLWTTHG